MCGAHIGGDNWGSKQNQKKMRNANEMLLETAMKGLNRPNDGTGLRYCNVFKANVKLFVFCQLMLPAACPMMIHLVSPWKAFPSKAAQTLKRTGHWRWAMGAHVIRSRNVSLHKLSRSSVVSCIVAHVRMMNPTAVAPWRILYCSIMSRLFR